MLSPSYSGVGRLSAQGIETGEVNEAKPALSGSVAVSCCMIKGDVLGQKGGGNAKDYR